MTYSPECVAEFEAKFLQEDFVTFSHKEQCYKVTEKASQLSNMVTYARLSEIADHRNVKLAAFAANWERVRELEKENAALLKIIRDEESRQARKLLEKGNE